MADATGKCQLVMKAEATPGTVETLESGGGLAANAEMILASNVQWTPDQTQTERSAQTASFSSRGSVPGKAMAKISWEMNLRGRTSAFSASVLPDCALPFRACLCSVTMSGGGGSEIVTVALTDTPSTWFTVGRYMDGRLYRIAGALGTCKIDWENGAPCKAAFEMTGVYVAPTDVALRTTGLALGSPMPPPFMAAAMTVLGFATPRPKTFSVDLGNVIAMEEDPNAAFGFYRAAYVGRKVVASIDPQIQPIATKNYFNENLVGTTGAVTTGTFPSTGSQYNKMNLTLPKAQYQKSPTGDRDGIGVVTLDLLAQANSDAGADEMTLVFS